MTPNTIPESTWQRLEQQAANQQISADRYLIELLNRDSASFEESTIDWEYHQECEAETGRVPHS